MAKKPTTSKQFAAAIKTAKREVSRLEKAKKSAAAATKTKKKSKSRKKKR